MDISVLILQHYCYTDMSLSTELFVHCTYTSLLQLETFTRNWAAYCISYLCETWKFHKDSSVQK